MPSHRDSSGDQNIFSYRYTREVTELLMERMRQLYLVGGCGYLLFYFLDVVNTPAEVHSQFLAIRLTVFISCLATIAISRFLKEKFTWLLIFSTIPMVLSGAGIAQMTTVLGGFSSDYYVGIMLVLFLGGLFMPWSTVLAGGVNLAICGVYVGLNLVRYGSSLDMMAPCFFLLTTSAFATYSSSNNNLRRQNQLRLRLQLQNTNDELMHANEAKTRFFANVSHELRTPLMLILAPLDRLVSAVQETPAENLVHTIRANGNRLLKQVNNILDVAKLEAGALKLQLRKGCARDLLNDLATNAKPYAESKRITIFSEGLDEIPAALFDGSKLEIVAGNLLSNALKFTPPGGKITIRCAKNLDDGFWGFEVADTGPGIHEADLDHLFDRFYQVDGSSSRKHEGTGLGLSLSRDLMRLHQGTLTVESTVGTGSCFKVVMPLEPKQRIERRRQARRTEDLMAIALRESLAADRAEKDTSYQTLMADVLFQSETEGISEAHGSAGTPLVLIVEDNADLRDLMRDELTRHYRVVTASDGVFGVEAARQHKPDIIVSDIMLPRMSGDELLTRVRKDRFLSEVPVIMVTARTDIQSVIECLEIGADDYLRKPFDMRELLARVEVQIRTRVQRNIIDERESRLAAVGNMTSTLVHDLRNPLSAIQTMATLLHVEMEERQEGQAVQDLNDMLHACGRLKGMLQDILDFSRGKEVKLAPKQVRAKDYLDQFVHQVTATLESRRIAFYVKAQFDNDLSIEIDSDRITRVLENIINNAAEALESATRKESNKKIALDAWTENNNLRIEVADSGPGIPDTMIEVLFESFATDKRGGTGLGLPTARNIVRAHGGDICAKPRGRLGGASFDIDLPLATSVPPKY